jgi:hypothetical protein
MPQFTYPGQRKARWEYTFDRDRIEITWTARKALGNNNTSPYWLLNQYVKGEFVEIIHGAIHYCPYRLDDGTEVLIIAEPDRSSATLCLPKEEDEGFYITGNDDE